MKNSLLLLIQLFSIRTIDVNYDSSTETQSSIVPIQYWLIMNKKLFVLFPTTKDSLINCIDIISEKILRSFHRHICPSTFSIDYSAIVDICLTRIFTDEYLTNRIFFLFFEWYSSLSLVVALLSIITLNLVVFSLLLLLLLYISMTKHHHTHRTFDWFLRYVCVIIKRSMYFSSSSSSSYSFRWRTLSFLLYIFQRAQRNLDQCLTMS